METETKKKRTREDIERELNLKRDRIEQRLSTLQQEVTSVGPSIRDAVLRHPLVGVGGALLAGLVVGLLVGGKKKRDDYGAGADHRALVDRYVEGIAEEARQRIAEGQDPDEAVQAAMKARVPLIVYEVPESPAKQGLFGLVAGLALRHLVPLGVEMGLGFLTGEAKGEAAAANAKNPPASESD